MKHHTILKLLNWFVSNKLSINLEKTCYTVFKGKSNKSVDINLVINNITPQKVSSCKYLGIVIDENLNWSEHIDFVF